MRPPVFSNEEVILAGKSLREAGRQVTGFALRSQLGAGNANRLKQIWEQYLASEESAPAAIPDLPMEVSTRLKNVIDDLGTQITMLVGDLHARAVRAAEARITELARGLDEHRQQADRELLDASSTVDDLEKQLAQLIEQRQARDAEIALLQDTSRTIAVELAAANEKLNAADQRIQLLTSELAALRQTALDGARLSGKLEALEQHNADLLAKLS